MVDNKVIYAFTAAGADAPPYINITRMADNSVRVIVRGKVYPNGSSGTEEIALSPSEWRGLADAVASEIAA